LTTVPDCIFCKIAAGELPATVVAADARALAFLDINPATRGHTLVIPRAHSEDVHDTAGADLAAAIALAQRVAALARERLGADGITLLNSSGRAAWQTVFHFHLHVIPRYHGDPLRLPWVPAPGDPAEIAAAAAAFAGP
jgi:histidine triad (HIT) family protein